MLEKIKTYGQLKEEAEARYLTLKTWNYEFETETGGAI